MKTGISRATKKFDFVNICIVGRGDVCEYNGTNTLFQLRPFPRGEGPKIAKTANGDTDFSKMEKDIEMLLSPKVS